MTSPRTPSGVTGAADAGSAAVGPPEREGRGATREEAAVDVLADLVATLDRACDELFATVPFLGDQETGARVNAAVDEIVGSLRDLRADADDLHRVMTIAGRRGSGGR